MAFIKSKKGFLALSAVVAAFALFAGVAFVQSQDVKPAVVKEAKGDAAKCPYTSGEKTAQTSAMPGSCSELHKQALAAGEMTKAEFANAEVKTADTKGACAAMTAEQCKEMLAAHGIKCDETDMKLCAEKMKAAGLCKDMDPAKCAEMAKSGACCAKGDMTAANATSTTDGAVKSAVATEKTGTAGKQCDWTKGSCETTQTAKAVSTDGK